jgi:hypothetical protein
LHLPEFPIGKTSYEGGRVVLAISTYTEPQAVMITADDPPQEENEGQGSFIQILASLLKQTDTAEAEEAVEIENFDIIIDNDDFNVEDAALLASMTQIPVIDQSQIIDPLELELPKELIGIEETVETIAEVIQEPVLTREVFAEIPKAEILAKIPETEQIDPELLSQAGIMALENEEVLVSEEPENKSGKKDLFENVKIEPAYEKKETAIAPIEEKDNKVNSKTRLDEARDKRKDKITFEVRDLRTDTQVSGLTEKAGTKASAEIQMELRLPNHISSNSEAIQQTAEFKTGSALENLLARELHQNFNGDIVRHASMILRDEGAGTIRLALKPESLGNVKIRLELAENKITGQIVVESEEALSAFRREVHALEQAFRETGFNSANLNLSLENRKADEQVQDFMPRMAASRYDDAIERVEASLVEVFWGRRQGSINVLA